MRRRSLAAAGCAAAITWSLAGPAVGEQAAPADVLMQDLAELSLEDLFAQEVSSVAKRPQSVKDAPAAVFVITREDIRRSGAATLPDVLRMVPGVEVAALTGAGAAVTARGFNGEFAGKLLILLDGRLIYVSTVAGVPWALQLTSVETIERIEVVRGPGATLYGANAVNGVINIITKHPVDTLGSFALAERDDDGSGRVTLRQGFAVGGTGALRISAELRRHRGRAVGPQGEGRDHADGDAVSFRYDVEPSHHDALTIQGDLSRNEARVEGVEPTTTIGRNILGRWARTTEGGGRTALQAYWEELELKFAPSAYKAEIVDLDFSQQLLLGSRHDLVYGLSYRRIGLTARGDQLNLPLIDQDWFGGFVQDEVRLAGERLKISAGVKVEKHPVTGFEVQPSLRAIWNDPAGWSAWAAVSRAVRTPSLIETEPFLDARPGFVLLPGAADPEVLVAAEAGWRGRITPVVSLDLAVFHNWYDDLIGLRTGVELFGGAPALVARPGSIGSATAYGIEASLDARLTDRWSLKAGAAIQDVRLSTDPGVTFVLATPASSAAPGTQFSLRSIWDVRDDLDLDIWLRRVGRLGGGVGQAYSDLDVRLAWRPTANLEVILKGQNLLEDRRLEFLAPQRASAVVDRRVSLGVAWRR